MTLRVADLDLTDRPSLFASLPPGLVIAEIGVDAGVLSRHILAASRPSKLYLVDPWLHWPNNPDPANVPQIVKEAQYREVKADLGADPRIEIMRLTSVQAAEWLLESGACSIDVVHIDGDHRQAWWDCMAWWPLVRRGGLLTGHDYLDLDLPDSYMTVKTDVDRFASVLELQVHVTSGGDDVYEQNYKSWVIEKR